MQMSQGQMIKLRYTSAPIVHNLPSIVLGFAKSHPYSHWRETILMYIKTNVSDALLNLVVVMFICSLSI